MAPSKTLQAISLYRSGQLKRALAIAKTFRMGLTVDEQKAISLAYECYTHPEFYRQLGTDIEASKKVGCQVFEQRIMRSAAN